MGEVRANMQKRQRSKGIGRVLLTPENRELELADHRVAKFMGEREQGIANDEPDELVALLGVESRNRGVGHPKRLAGLSDPRLELVVCGKRVSRSGDQACAEKDGSHNRPDRHCGGSRSWSFASVPQQWCARPFLALLSTVEIDPPDARPSWHRSVT